jgi:hypothetical protein
MANSPKYKQTKISIKPEVWEQIKLTAKELGMPANHYVEKIFLAEIESQKFK